MSTDVEPLVRAAEALWNRGRAQVRDERCEIYLKQARRRRFDRDRTSASLEIGTAFRWTLRDRRLLAHVAIGGMSDAGLERAIADARAESATEGTLAEGVPMTRVDLEGAPTEMDEAAIRDRFRSDPKTRWIEVGWTTEVLVGPGGWTASRTRARSLVTRGEHPYLVPRRGARLLAEIEAETRAAEGEALSFSPDAAAVVVTALFQARVSPGWDLWDDPLEPEGWAGGAFDDAGFPSRKRHLFLGGRGEREFIGGPGNLWRRSFRDPPRPLPSTLVVGGKHAPSFQNRARHVAACRIVPLGREWVLEIDGDHPRVIRTTPATLARAFRGTTGASRLTPDGVMTPRLVFEDPSLR